MTKSQKNLKSQFSKKSQVPISIMTLVLWCLFDACSGSYRDGAYLMLEYWYLFVICDLLFGASDLGSAIIRSLLRDFNIMSMTLPHTSIGDANKLSLLQRLQIFRAAITHPCSQAAGVLKNDFT